MKILVSLRSKPKCNAVFALTTRCHFKIREIEKLVSVVYLRISSRRDESYTQGTLRSREI
jgi:hypothetical protein